MSQPDEFTREQIAAMTADEYAANRGAIMAQVQRDAAARIEQRRAAQASVTTPAGR